MFVALDVNVKEISAKDAILGSCNELTKDVATQILGAGDVAAEETEIANVETDRVGLNRKEILSGVERSVGVIVVLCANSQRQGAKQRKGNKKGKQTNPKRSSRFLARVLTTSLRR